MPEYLYQIKGKKDHEDGFLGPWDWPPLFTGKVEAPDKKAAKLLVEEEYGKTFPLRVLRQDLDSNEFLLHLKEIKEDDHYTRRLFEVRECRHCHKPFKVIEKYTFGSPGGGHDFCCRECSREYDVANGKVISSTIEGSSYPVIYCITNKTTGMSYVGKTRQAFTLRWWQHFSQPSNTKFHQAIKDTPITDWRFEIVEVVQVPDDVRAQGVLEMDRFICAREMEWIIGMNSIRAGYNTQGLVDDGQQALELEGAA